MNRAPSHSSATPKRTPRPLPGAQRRHDLGQDHGSGHDHDGAPGLEARQGLPLGSRHPRQPQDPAVEL